MNLQLEFSRVTDPLTPVRASAEPCLVAPITCFKYYDSVQRDFRRDTEEIPGRMSVSSSVKRSVRMTHDAAQPSRPRGLREKSDDRVSTLQFFACTSQNQPFLTIRKPQKRGRHSLSIRRVCWSSKTWLLISALSQRDSHRSVLFFTVLEYETDGELLSPMRRGTPH